MQHDIIAGKITQSWYYAVMQTRCGDVLMHLSLYLVHLLATIICCRDVQNLFKIARHPLVPETMNSGIRSVFSGLLLCNLATMHAYPDVLYQQTERSHCVMCVER